VGDRVLADNPSGEEDRSLGQVDPRTWRKVELRAAKRDGGWAEVVLLRPASWLEERQARAGGRLYIAVPECGIDGNAEVLRIGPCPAIKPGRGQVVTGTFRHSSAQVLDVRLEGQEAPIGTTANHLFWSEDEEDFVRAEELEPGETLRTLNGTTTVVALAHRPGTQAVYNLEVELVHTYHVSRAGVLVHNGAPPACPGNGQTPNEGTPGKNQFGKRFRKDQKELFPEDEAARQAWVNRPRKTSRWDYSRDWHDKRATEIFGPGDGPDGKGRSIGARTYDKFYKGKDIEFKSGNWRKKLKKGIPQDELDRMSRQADRDMENKRRRRADPHWHFEHDPRTHPQLKPLLEKLTAGDVPWTWGPIAPF
jgi:hypothetical protein